MARVPYPEHELVEFGQRTARSAMTELIAAPNDQERKNIINSYALRIFNGVAAKVNPDGAMSDFGVWLCRDASLMAFNAELDALGLLPPPVLIHWTKETERERERLEEFARRVARETFAADREVPEGGNQLGPAMAAFEVLFDEARLIARQFSEEPGSFDSWNVIGLNAFGEVYAALNAAWSSNEGGQA